ncbi:neuraminidase-like domain-containing protein [Photorhabdus temperata]|uniref:neuraminidase-like domain-containing protein n=1 Tax=Photorhabdus temperata TaxID=574560 RepID=UPI00038A4EFA|nr:neuraminidase-like domain-containing protein [Photorhabdus temperata]EQC00815.1 insecticidal toxin complex protein TcdA1 [Photorhabdus temperata subsp. temperata M1021]
MIKKKRLAQVYALDLNAVTQLIGLKTNLNVTTGAQLQRLVAFGRSSGWSLNDLQTLLEKGPLIEEWKVQQPLSQRCGPRKELARKALNTKLGEFRNKALLSLYKTTCRRSFIESEHKTWGAAFGEHEPNTTDVAGQLLMDPEMSAAVPTSRVAEAIASVQAFIQRIADGRESEWQLTAGELQRWRNNDSRYALWAANMQLRWHPDQYINPTTRQNKTLAFRQFENSLSQARLDQDSIEVALTEYLHNFEQVVNLETLGAYQDGMNSSQSPIYFLGRSPNAPFAYYSRRWGIDSSGLRRWSAWEKIDLPTSSNVMTRGDQTNPGWANYQTKHINDKKEYLPVQARLVVLTGRLYFIWVEARVVTPEQMVPDSANSGGKSTVPGHKDSVKSKGDGTFPEHQATKKRYRHVISLVHRRLDGGWSTPIELYQGKPADYLDPAPNLVAFAIPQYAADLKDITYAEKGTDSDGNPTGEGSLLFKQAPTISGDLLLVSLNVVATDPEQKNAGSQYWLFDSFLDEIRTSPRKDKDSTQRQSNGLDLAKCDQTHPVVKTINELVKRSYFYVKPDACSSQVITPCIPDHWLFNERQWISRGEAVFGNKVSLTLTVKDAGQANRNSYETLSTVELTPQQWAAIPAGSRLVHFLSLQGRAKYQQITQEISRVSLVTRYPSGPLSAKEVYHGVMLIPNGSSTVVAIDNVDNALIEQGKLAVAHNFVEALGAEIKESAQGVQYLVTQYLEGQDIEQDAHSLHGTPQLTDGRQTVAMKGMACKLFVNLNAVTDITPAMLQAQDDWMSADFIPAPNGTRLSLWAYDVPAEQNKRKQVWLVTRVTGSSQLVALKKLTLPENVTAYQIAGNKLNKITLSTLKENDPPVVYILTKINVPESSEKTYYQNCSLPLADMTAFGPMSFTFLLTHREQSNGKDIAPAGVALKVISERELQEDLKLNAGQTVFTSEDWGWTAPVFSTTTLPYTLNRTYRLPSAECQYFVVKVKVDQIAITKMADKHFVGFSISVQSPLSLPAYVIGLKNNTQTQCAIDGKSIAQRDNTLSVVGASELAVHTFLAQYDTLFFALPWTANAFADVRKDGLRFQLGNLKNQATIPGYIPCEVPSLSTAIITSSCSPTQVNVGDVVHITASIDLGAAHFSDGAHIEIALNNAYELLVSGISTPAGTQVGSNQLRLQLTAGQREASFSLPVRVRDTIANLLPLATLTVSDKRSVERVLLAQPAIGSGLNSQLAVQWHWQYGTDPQHLLTSATDRPITALALDQKYLLTALTLHPQAGSTDDRYTVKFTLPKGIEVENAAAKLTALDNIAALKKSIALLEPTWKTTMPDGTGNALVTLLSNKPLTEATLLVLPLKLTNKKGFIGAIKVEVIRGDDAANCWTAQSYPFWQPKKIKDVLTISAGCNPAA